MVLEFRDLWVKLRVEAGRTRDGAACCPGARRFAPASTSRMAGRARRARIRHRSTRKTPANGSVPRATRLWKPLRRRRARYGRGGVRSTGSTRRISSSVQRMRRFFDPHLKFGKISAVEPIGAMGRIPLQEITRMVLLADAETHQRSDPRCASALVTEVTTAQALWPRAQELAAMIAQTPSGGPWQGSLRAIWGGNRACPRAPSSHQCACATSKSANQWPLTRRPLNSRARAGRCDD